MPSEKKRENPTGTVPNRPAAGTASLAQAALDRLGREASDARAEASAQLWKLDNERAQALLDVRWFKAELAKVTQERDQLLQDVKDRLDGESARLIEEGRGA